MRKSERMRLSRRASFFTTPSVWARSSRGEGFLHAEERRRVDDGGQGIPDLVGHARGELARRGQALGLGEPRLQPFALRHVGDQLEEKDLAVGLAYRGAAQREAPPVRAAHLDALRLAHLLTALERTAGAGLGAAPTTS